MEFEFRAGGVGGLKQSRRNGFGKIQRFQKYLKDGNQKKNSTIGMKEKKELRMVTRYLARWTVVSLRKTDNRGGAGLGDKFSIRLSCPINNMDQKLQKEI